MSIGSLTLLGLLASIPAVAGWNVDDRCLRRRHLRSSLMGEAFLNEEAEIMNEFSAPNADEMNTQPLTERELQSANSATGYSFNMKLYWEPGYCWQAEWDERDWCMSCQGNPCMEGDALVLKTCKTLDRQRFTWLPTKGGGRLKTFSKNLCLEKVAANTFELRVCTASTQQIFVGFNATGPFELNPFSNIGVRCLHNQHHPKWNEKMTTSTCDVARRAHTSKWKTYWPTGKYNSTIPPTVPSGKTLTELTADCTSSNPCGECVGDCATDDDCQGDLKCYIRSWSNPFDPIPGCTGSGRERWDYCYNPKPSSPAPTPVSTGSLSLVFPIRKCSATSPCGLCQGDCQFDLDCLGDLVCFQKTGNVTVPGCRGSDPSRTDWCIDPKNL